MKKLILLLILPLLLIGCEETPNENDNDQSENNKVEVTNNSDTLSVFLEGVSYSTVVNQPLQFSHDTGSVSVNLQVYAGGFLTVHLYNADGSILNRTFDEEGIISETIYMKPSHFTVNAVNFSGRMSMELVGSGGTLEKYVLY